MARVLFGWELGANRGHIVAMQSSAAALLDAGHEVVFALQQIDAGGLDLDPRIALWQAPLWPRLLISLAQPNRLPTATMGDILCRLGLDRPGTLTALIKGWDAILTAAKPDLVVADFAPALLTAARGRVPTVQTGTAFACPPASAGKFPALREEAPAYDEEAILDLADADLHAAGRGPLAGLPALFAADHNLIASFAELDPYAGLRTDEVHCAPSIMAPVPAPTGGQGDEIFVYLFQQVPAGSPAWKGLARSGLRVRIYMPGASASQLQQFSQLKFSIEQDPVPFPQIAARSRLALSHGGHGFVSACLVAGLPQIVAWYDLEKQLTGTTLAAKGLCREVSLFASSADDVTRAIASALTDHRTVEQCRAAAPGFAARMGDTVAARITTLAAAL